MTDQPSKADQSEQVFFSSRSRSLEYQQCPRARYWLHEAFGTGFELIQNSIPLAVGGAVHKGLADLLNGWTVNDAVADALAFYDSQCLDRGFVLHELESQTFVYAEQRALTEALIRLASSRVVPKLLETYEVLEVERKDETEIFRTRDQDGSDWSIRWRSIPDALLRRRDDGSLYLLSWKTCGDFSRLTEESARIDVQGISEAWTWTDAATEDHIKFNAQRTEGRLALARMIEESHVVGRYGFKISFQVSEPDLPSWRNPPGPIAGIQYVYLIKGKREKQSDGSYRTITPLIYGWRDEAMPPNLAPSFHWTCSAPHPMRKSQWYPTGECPGDGRRHERRGSWTRFSVWDSIGVADWMDLMADPAPGSTWAAEPGAALLDEQWRIPVPSFRTDRATESWYAQMEHQEVQIARDLIQIREPERLVAEGREGSMDLLISALDRTFPQRNGTGECVNWFGGKCPAYEICWGADHIAADPIGSGLYQARTPYKEQKQEDSDAVAY